MTYEEILTKKKQQEEEKEALRLAQGKSMRPWNKRFAHLYPQRQLNAPCPCIYCMEDFQTAEERANHTRDKHTRTHKFVCSTCGRLFMNSTLLESHVEAKKCTETRDPTGNSSAGHTKKVEKKFACNKPLNNSTGELCPYKASTVTLVKKHIALKHEWDEREKVECKECHKILKSEALFKTHYYRMHTEEGRKAYAKYEQKTRDKEKAKRREADARGFVCLTCNVDYVTKQRYTTHMMRVHDEFGTRDAVVQCELCGKKFPGAYRLRKHRETTHTDGREFMCELCGKNFKKQNSLNEHLRITHSEEGRRRHNEYTREKNRTTKLIQEAIARKEMGGNAVEAPDSPEQYQH